MRLALQDTWPLKKSMGLLIMMLAIHLAALQPLLSAQEKKPARVVLKADMKNASPEKIPEGAASLSSSEKPQLTGVSFQSMNGYTRVALDISHQVRYEINRLPADATKGLPPRIYIDIFGAQLGMDSREGIKIDDGIVRQIRVGQFSADVVRAVIEVNGVRSHKLFEAFDPYRIVIDVQGQKDGEASASVERNKPAPVIKSQGPSKNEVAATAEPSPSVITPPAAEQSKSALSSQSLQRSKSVVAVAKEIKPPLLVGLKKIVLDPGHGGKDPGAIGVDGVAEKDIVLKVAKKLALKLKNDLGVQVVLTRNDDRFVSLEDRTAIANAEDADLFISLHMNASPNGEARGLETYYLDNTTDEASLRLAARENSTSRKNISDLQFILSDMTQNMKLEDSVTLAHRLHDSLVSSMSPKLGEIKDLGVKKALFYVLVGARMPSVLVEMFFITNKNEGRAMRQDEYQDAVTDALYEGIRKYQDTVLAGKTL